MTLPNYISMARGAFGPVLGAAHVAEGAALGEVCAEALLVLLR